MGLANSKPQAINIPPVQVHDIETSPEKRTRTLKHLIRANHVNHSIICRRLEKHNDMPHVLGSTYLLGGESEHLNDIYDEKSVELDSWEDSPSEVSRHDWRDFLGDRRYQRAFIDFFEDELVRFGYNWKKVLAEYLLKGREPLIHGLIGGLGHPLIHLGYAYELNNSVLAIEALGFCATDYHFLHKYLDNPPLDSAPNPSSSILTILNNVSADSQFNDLFVHPGPENIEPLFDKHEHAVLEYWNSWEIEDPREQFEESVGAAILLLTTTHKMSYPTHDIFLVRLLTTSYAVRILLPIVPAEWQLQLVREWWLFALVVYIAQLRPKINEEYIEDYDLRGRNWRWVSDRALNGQYSKDAQFVAAIRAMKEAEVVWGKKDGWYLRAAVKFAGEFIGWTGSGSTDTGL
ncbi:hypothetical protein FGG08_006092 [Glutinoglossum americanum]|uniref:MGS207 protein n=1 Tax=Glutinoglossum americanum TaxID=1670608 RepID=A0A9P8I1N4_9PEZI|nr:hypothetical protein FGG08_006092 [Glutinoglossum americanum]